MSTDVESIPGVMLGSKVQYLTGDDATRKKWDARTRLELWEHVALHSRLDPDLLLSWEDLEQSHRERQAAGDFEREWFDPEGFFWEPEETPDPRWDLYVNIQRAALDALCRTLPAERSTSVAVERWTVSVEDFAVWAKRKRLPRVDGFGVRGGALPPWGSYTTPKLELLVALLRCFWRLVEDGGTYDRQKPWTAPHPKKIREFLRQHAAPKYWIDFLMWLTRDPGLRRGPHPKPPLGRSAD